MLLKACDTKTSVRELAHDCRSDDASGSDDAYVVHALRLEPVGAVYTARFCRMERMRGHRPRLEDYWVILIANGISVLTQRGPFWSRVGVNFHWLTAPRTTLFSTGLPSPVCAEVTSPFSLILAFTRTTTCSLYFK